MAPHKKRYLKLHSKRRGSSVKKARPALVLACAMKVPEVALHRLNLELYHQNGKWNIKKLDDRLLSDQGRQEDLVPGEKLTKPPYFGQNSCPPPHKMAPHKKQRLKLHSKRRGSSVKKAHPPLVSACAMKVPEVALHRLNLELYHQNIEWNVKKPDDKLLSDQGRQEDLVPGEKLFKPPHIEKTSCPPPCKMALHKKRYLKLHSKRRGSSVKKARPPLVSACAMKVPEVALHRLNLELYHQNRKRNVKKPDDKLLSDQGRQEVTTLGNRKAHAKMALFSVAQRTRLPHSTGFTRNHDEQDCDQKTICRKQLRVQLVRMNIETKNQLEGQATDVGDRDHEDVRPTNGSHLHVQHENRAEQSADDSNSDQFNEQDLEKLSPYERQRLKNIRQNAEFLRSIKLLEVASSLCLRKKRRIIVKREKSQIDTIIRRSNRLKGIAPPLQMLDKNKQ